MFHNIINLLICLSLVFFVNSQGPRIVANPSDFIRWPIDSEETALFQQNEMISSDSNEEQLWSSEADFDEETISEEEQGAEAWVSDGDIPALTDEECYNDLDCRSKYDSCSNHCCFGQRFEDGEWLFFGFCLPISIP